MALIGLISDVHASPKPLEEALKIFSDRGVELILCAGDIAGYMDQLEQTIALLLENGCYTVVGNHDLSYLEKQNKNPNTSSIKFLKNLPVIFEANIEGKKLCMVHAQPPDECHGGIKLLDKQGAVQSEQVSRWEKILKPFDYDVLVVGHTHQVFAEFMGKTLVVNPGSTAFNNSCAILSLPDMTVEIFSLSGKKIEKTWNWGMHVINAK